MHDLASRLYLVIGAILLAASAPLARAATTNVSYGSFFFSPKVVQIKAGDTINWTGGGAHNATGTGADPMCGTLPCSRTFNTAGTYPYVCTIGAHAANGMTGLVLVVPPVIVPAVITNLTRLPNGDMRLAVSTTANQTNVVQATTNLSVPASWVPVAVTRPSSNSFIWTDTNAGSFPLRFYRVVEPK